MGQEERGEEAGSRQSREVARYRNYWVSETDAEFSSSEAHNITIHLEKASWKPVNKAQELSRLNKAVMLDRHIGPVNSTPVTEMQACYRFQVTAEDYQGKPPLFDSANVT
ncbi:hypothetical protein STEG23_028406 [Scotinomys teguina]